MGARIAELTVKTQLLPASAPSTPVR